MQVGWSPIARCTSAAATEESTPPDRPQITRAAPVRSRTLRTSSSMNAPGVHVGAARRVRDLRVKLHAEPRTLAVSVCRDRTVRAAREHLERVWQVAHLVAVAH